MNERQRRIRQRIDKQRRGRQVSRTLMWIGRISALVCGLYLLGILILSLGGTVGINGVVGVLGLLAGGVVLAIGIGGALSNYMRGTRWQDARQAQKTKLKNEGIQQGQE